VNKQNPTPANANNSLKPGVLGGLVILAIVLVLIFSQMLGGHGNQISLNDLVQQINSGKIKSITVRNDTDLVIQLRTADNSGNAVETATKEQSESLISILQKLGVKQDAFAQIDYVAESGNNISLLLNIAFTVLPMLIIGWFLWRMLRSMRMGQDQALSFGRSRAKVTRDAERPMVTFNDVAGAEEAKQDLREIVEFLKEPDKFIQLGARIPKGVLMVGAPGTGKTLLARAVAGEAGSPFFSISGSEFVEMFVGVGASRVRDLFERAKAEAPSIIFVDEIDAVGRQRGAGLGGGHDEREQTLNQILVEMDGFDKNTNIIVVAATNRPDVLDPALLRPGRFDRKVFLDRPDRVGRLAILQVHTRGKPLASDVDLDTLAKLTPGFVGADLENMINEAAILAARRGKKAVSMREMQEGFERVIAGPERKSRVISPNERRIIAFHEAGHAVVTHNLEHANPVHKITIVSRGQAGGYMMSLPENDETLASKVKFEDEMVGLLGGRAAEEITFESVTSGASNDLQRATSIARSMITRYGMSQELGLRTFGEPEGAIFLGRELVERRDYSEEAAAAIDVEVSRMIEIAYKRAKDILVAHRDKLNLLAQTLLEQETIDREAFEAIMNTQTAPVASIGQPA
jgi:cell division protease FtsH